MARILIIDDEAGSSEWLRDLLTAEGYGCRVASSSAEALARLSEQTYQLALLDLRLGSENGLELLPKLRSAAGYMPVVVITAYGTVRDAVEAMKRGALDFVPKPLEVPELLCAVRSALDLATPEPVPEGLMVVEDPKSRALVESIGKIGPTDASVLITGETGVGKEVVARLVHASSRRSTRPFVKVSCAALSGTLFESELFGHERGAFTGAMLAKPGRVELAHGGTLFLDEIGELSMPVQAKLLQFLQDGTFERVGGTRTLKADVRLVCATHRAVEGNGGSLRSDLFYRINKVHVAVPPLRERPLDVEPLALHFLRRAAVKYGRGAMEMSPEAMDLLRRHSWPGNVRELEHMIERMVLMVRGTVITRSDVPFANESGRYGSPVLRRTLRQEKREFERDKLIEALRMTHGNRTQAARALGISRRMLHRKLKQLALTDRDL
jgi:DNA-binding NtrC family response regulator